MTKVRLTLSAVVEFEEGGAPSALVTLTNDTQNPEDLIAAMKEGGEDFQASISGPL